MDTYYSEVLSAMKGPTSSSSVTDLHAVLDSIVHAAQQLVPDTHVGITAASSTGTFTTLAATDRLVFRLDDLQYDFDEGPCLTAIREDHTVIVDDAESEHRWPLFMPPAIEIGLRSHLGVPVPVDDHPRAGLNMYSTTHTRLDAARLSCAKLFAEQAATAMRHAAREDDLLRALQSSRTIGKAIGLIMERFGRSDDEAFAYLVHMSQHTNMKLRDIAAHLVEQANDLRHYASPGQPAGLPQEPATWPVVDNMPARPSPPVECP